MKALFYRAMQTLFKWMTRIQSVPHKSSDIEGLALSGDIVYVLPSRSYADVYALSTRCEKLDLPSPFTQGKEPNRFMFLRRPQRMFSRSLYSKRQYKKFHDLLETQAQNPERDIQLVPVSVIWGGHPGNTNSIFKLMFADTANATWLRKIFILLFQGRQGIVHFSAPIHLKDVLKLHNNSDTCMTKMTRTLMVHFHRKRIAILGPEISARGHMINRIIASDEVQRAIDREVEQGKKTRAEATQDAKKYLKEIASHFGYWAIQLLKRILKRLWTKWYQGVEVHHVDAVRELAQNHSIVYLPCHRSHIDYLLLSYLLSIEGLALPKIAAGINLNFWPAGPILRRGGAFFIRRTFSGNKLYTAVFSQYLLDLFNQGYSVEFFPEGGRSRTGRLLQPKTGLLSMTLHAAARGTRKPIAIVPVHICYERIMEGKSYDKEMRGGRKKNESAGQLLGIRSKLKRSYGKVHVNFGEAIHLNQYLDDHVENRGIVGSEKPEWLFQQTSHLAKLLMKHLNKAAVVNSVNLVSAILLNTPRHALDCNELQNQMDLSLALMQQGNKNATVAFPADDVESLYMEAKAQGAIQEAQHKYGNIAYISADEATMMTYYRNNIMHLLAMPSLIAAALMHHGSIPRAELLQICRQFYPLLQNELFIGFELDEIDDYVNQLLGVLQERELISVDGDILSRPVEETPALNSLSLLGQIIGQTLERYAITLTLLTSGSNHGYSRAQLEEQSSQLAQRLSILHGINAPEFSDKSLFKTFIATLKDHSMLSQQNGGLYPTPQTHELFVSVLELMRTSVRRSLERVIRNAETATESDFDAAPEPELDKTSVKSTDDSINKN
jgi:glycerol-3-phosphate O-acyltransferase